MFSQLWHTGRASHIGNTNGAAPLVPSVVPYQETVSTPNGWSPTSLHRALDIAEISGVNEEYRRAAEHAKAAGFDGVELHDGNGYCPTSFRMAATSELIHTADLSRS
jgi:N-ethylmaleimide reductase